MLHGLISALGIATLKSEVSAIAQRTGRRAVLFALVVVLWLAAFGFALAAFTVWLAGQLGVVAACAIVAAALTVVGLALQLGLALTTHRRPQPGISLPLTGLSAPAAGGTANDGGALGSLALVAVLGWLLGRQMGRK